MATQEIKDIEMMVVACHMDECRMRGVGLSQMFSTETIEGNAIAHAVVKPGQGVDGKMFFEKRMWRFDDSVYPELERIITADSFYNFTSSCTVKDGVTYTPSGSQINSHGLLVWIQQWLRHRTLRERMHREWQAEQRKIELAHHKTVQNGTTIDGFVALCHDPDNELSFEEVCDILDVDPHTWNCHDVPGIIDDQDVEMWCAGILDEARELSSKS